MQHGEAYLAATTTSGPMIAKLLRSRRAAAAPSSPAVPEGERIYAVGDVHGRLDLLDELVAKVDRDDAARGPSRTTLIFLGDLVDRGPESAGVVARLRELAATSTAARRIRFIHGNHEEIFLSAVEGDNGALRMFCRVGGRETALSYGIAEAVYERSDYAELAELLAQHVPAEDRKFMAGFEDMITIGDYAFVHAGVEPNTPFGAQSRKHLRWIRDSFLDHRGGMLEKMVVHGHTPTDQVEFRPHRIGIDTGAYASGRLTALGLEGTEQWLLQTG